MTYLFLVTTPTTCKLFPPHWGRKEGLYQIIDKFHTLNLKNSSIFDKILGNEKGGK